MTRGKHFAPLDGLRGVAALMVLAVHGGLFALNHATGLERSLLSTTLPAWGLLRTGVQLFFVLSGFLLFLPYAQAARGQRAWPSARTFYIRRLRRVGPAYWIALTILAVAFGASVGDYLLHVAFVQNATVGTFKSINDVFWSMAVEVQFYAALPLLAVAVRRWGRLALVAMVLVSPVAQAGLIAAERVLPDVQRYAPAVSLFTYLSVFAAGMLAADLWASGERPAWLRHARWIGTLAIAAEVFVFAARLNVGKFDALFFDTWFGFAYAAILLGALAAQRRPPLLTSAPLIWCGMVSYSLYIWHTVIGRVLGDVNLPPGLALASVALAAMVLALPLAYVSYGLTEQPFMAKPTRERVTV